MIIIELLAAIIILAALAFYRVSKTIWVPTNTLLLLSLSFSPIQLSWWFLVPVWAIFVLAALVVMIKPLRLRLLSQPAFNYFRKALPAMSHTERVALDAGEVWWDGE